MKHIFCDVYIFEILYYFLIRFLSDPNAIQLLFNGEHIGHVNREIASVLSPLMDMSSPESRFYDRFDKKNHMYGKDFNMYCSLCYCDTNHAAIGYKMQIIVDSSLKSEWVDIVASILEENNLEFRRL